MRANSKIVVWFFVSTVALVACGGGGGGSSEPAAHTSPDPQQSAFAPLNGYKYLVAASDQSGYISFYGDNGVDKVANLVDAANTTITAGPFHQTTDITSPTLGLGEIRFSKDGKKMFVVASSNVMNGSALVGSGLLIFNTETLALQETLPMPVSKTGYPSRLVHAYLDHDGQHIWLTNDGPSIDDPATVLDERIQPDSIFRVNIDSADANYKKIDEILVGDGRQAGALAFKFNQQQSARALFATYNMSAQTISIIDNDPNATTFLSVAKTADLKTGGKTNVPGGMDYSLMTGKIYTGITNGADMALSIIDAKDADLATSSIRVGAVVDGKIPAAGFVRAVDTDEAAGRWVMTVGYKNSHGYLSVLDPTTDTVKDVIDLGDLKASRFDIARVRDSNERHIVVFAAGTSANPEPALAKKIAVVRIDEVSGMRPVGHQLVALVDVDAATDERNGATTPGNERVYYANGGGQCAAEPRDDSCRSINVINVADLKVTKIATAGTGPASIAVLALP